MLCVLLVLIPLSSGPTSVDRGLTGYLALLAPILGTFLVGDLTYLYHSRPGPAARGPGYPRGRR